MLVPPTTTVSVITWHHKNCPHKSDAKWRHCDCRKSLYIYDDGRTIYNTTRTRSWEQAEWLAVIERNTRERISRGLIAMGLPAFPERVESVPPSAPHVFAPPPASSRPIHPMLEQHYTIGKLSKMWGFSAHTIRAWFEDEPGCLMIHHPEKMHKRGYTSIRVPHSVAERVYQRHTSKYFEDADANKTPRTGGPLHDR